MAYLFAVRMAFLAFAVIAIRGVGIGSDFSSTVSLGLVISLLFYGLGFVCGTVGQWLVEEQVHDEFQRWLIQLDGTESPGAPSPG